MNPYRVHPFPPGEEEDLWFRLDEALLEVFRDPVWSWGVAWQVALDAGDRFPEVRDAASGLMSVIGGMEICG